MRNKFFTQAETRIDWALRVATQYGYFTKAEAKDYLYNGCHRKDGKTTYSFTHAGTGESLTVYNRWHSDSHTLIVKYYDYDNQCYIVNGKVDPCNHPATMHCGCYGRLHAGEPATAAQAKNWDDRLSAQ